MEKNSSPVHKRSQHHNDLPYSAKIDHSGHVTSWCDGQLLKFRQKNARYGISITPKRRVLEGIKSSSLDRSQDDETVRRHHQSQNSMVYIYTAIVTAFLALPFLTNLFRRQCGQHDEYQLFGDSHYINWDLCPNSGQSNRQFQAHGLVSTRFTFPSRIKEASCRI